MMSHHITFDVLYSYFQVVSDDLIRDTDTRATFTSHILTSFRTARNLAYYFLRTLIERLQPRDDDAFTFKMTRTIIRSICEDALAVVVLPEWPAAEHMLSLMAVHLMQLMRGEEMRKPIGLCHQTCHVSCNMSCLCHVVSCDEM